MRGQSKVHLLLAPLLAAALPTRLEVNNTPHALINFDISTTEDEVAAATLRLNILESTSPCGYGNVTLNDQTLAQDESGDGSGSITTENGNIILANWGFTCVHLEDEFQGQLMTFDVISVDDKKTDDVGFTVQFQQMTPVSVSLINGTGSTVEILTPSQSTNEVSNKQTSAPLDAELAELKSMMRQLAALEYAISSKVHHISETYDFKFQRPHGPHDFHSLSSCDSLKCVVKTMYVRAKHMASRLYGHGFEGGHHGKPGRHHWPFHHEGKHGHGPPWFLQHHGNGNHSHPFPPHHRPHGEPHWGPPHGPHGPHGEPPHHFHHPPPFCDCGPPPPPHDFHGEHPPHGHPPPPPPPPPHFPPHHGASEDEMPGRHGPNEGFDKDMGPPEDFDEDRPERPLHDEDGPDFPPRPNHHDEPHHDGPPHDGPHHDGPHHDGPGPHHEGPGPHHEGHGPHGPHGPMSEHPPHHPPHFGPPGLFHAISTIHIIAVVVLLGLLASALHTRCFTTARANRRSGCGGGCRGRDTRCQQHGFWATRREAINNRYCEIVRWVKDGAKNDELEDEEKEAIMRQLHRPESDDEDNISTTMEQEIAQFRAVASVVGDIIEAEEGRSREMSQHSSPQNSSPQHSSPVPLSPTSAFPDCASIDEELPAYDEGSNDPRFVADGFRYTPGSSCYTPTESSTTGSSLDEHLGRKD